MTYNLSYVSNVTGPMQLVQRVNEELMFSWYGNLILIATFTILFFAVLQKTQHAGKALATSAFICFGLSIFLRAVGLVGEIAMFILLVAAAGSVALLKRAE